MKRLISAVLALSLMGTVAASAQPFRGGHDVHDRVDHRDYRAVGWNHNRADGTAMIGLGLGLFALAAIASSHERPDDHYRDGYYYGR
jgi:hypothetical protein